MTAPVCPINHSQNPATTRTLPTPLPSIPIATDLPSLIRSVNIIRDILRNITTSLTVNNTYLPRDPRPPPIPPKTNYLMSAYPDWVQVSHTVESGFVYRKSGPDQVDPSQRACVKRIFEVEFRNTQRDSDTSFYWRVKKPLDSSGGSSKTPPFQEDFFERVVNVKWGGGLAVEFGDGAQGPANAPQDAAEEAGAE